MVQGSPEEWNNSNKYGKAEFEENTQEVRKEFSESELPILNSKRSPEAEPGGKRKIEYDFYFRTVYFVVLL